MDASRRSGAQSSPDRLREIPKWAERYAFSRSSLAMAVVLAIMGTFFFAWSGLSYLAGRASTAGDHVRTWVFGALEALAVLGFCWFVLRHHLADTMAALSRREDRSDGEVVPIGGGDVARTGEGEVDLTALFEGHRVGAYMYSGVLVVGLVAQFALAAIINLPERYMQPISAAYMVPLLVYGILTWFRAAPPMLLWPLLYAAHAALILFGVRMGFLDSFPVGVAVPLLGYGAVAFLASYIYGRYALRRLRELAYDPTDGGGGEAHGGDA